MVDKQRKPIISLCIPTNGIKEWMIPVLDSIYNSSTVEEEFEVIVTDNGNNNEFKEYMRDYVKKQKNIIYYENESYLFHNQLEALKLGHGLYLKFINHRAPLVEGALDYMISIIKENIENKPTLFFSNGKMEKDVIECISFDSFVSTLGIYASWTTGVGVWREEFERIKDNLTIDRISPHSCVLFSRKKDDLYKIYNYVFSKELTSDHSKKGTYDLFKAFGIEELAITQNLYLNDDITIDTFKKVKKDYESFLSTLYYNYCLRKKPCSYDLSGFDSAMGVYFQKKQVIFGAYRYGIKKLLHRILNKLGIKKKSSYHDD